MDILLDFPSMHRDGSIGIVTRLYHVVQDAWILKAVRDAGSRNDYRHGKLSEQVLSEPRHSCFNYVQFN